MFEGCQFYKGGNHLATTCLKLNEPQPKCAKCDMFHKTKNCEIKCSLCSRLGHSKDRCWKEPKNGKSNSKTIFFLEVLLNDEEATMQQLNKLCRNENVFSYTQVLRKRMFIEVALSGTVQTFEVIREGTRINKETSIRSQILSHFIKRKISLSLMYTILMILGELEHLESLIKLAR
jgi:hypothetical protein